LALLNNLVAHNAERRGLISLQQRLCLGDGAQVVGTGDQLMGKYRININVKVRDHTKMPLTLLLGLVHPEAFKPNPNDMQNKLTKHSGNSNSNRTQSQKYSSLSSPNSRFERLPSGILSCKNH
jgi:hypothetical protein